MTDFKAVDPELIRAAAQTGLDGLAEALARTFGGQRRLAISEGVEPLGDIAQLNIRETVLVFQARIGDSCVAAILPSSAGLAPNWAAAPDDDQRAKLGAFAQEMFSLTLPEDFTASEQRFDLLNSQELFSQISLGESPHILRIEVESPAAKSDRRIADSETEPTEAENPSVAEQGSDRTEAKTDTASGSELILIWPTMDIADLSNKNEAVGKAATASTPSGQQPVPTAPQQRTPRIQFTDVADGIRQLPSYARSILKISVPVRVTLASRKMGVDALNELAPGSIIEFKKSCEDTLSLEIGKQQIAEGEAVRVGEKFGLWITSIKLPDERFSVANGHPNASSN